jgi:hypothetical protein
MYPDQQMVYADQGFRDDEESQEQGELVKCVGQLQRFEAGQRGSWALMNCDAPVFAKSPISRGWGRK